MPTYDYECQDCGHAFEVRASISQKVAGLHPECPKCHGQDARQAFRSVMFIGRASDGADRGGPVGGCGPLCGPGPC
jgi:putative FmdB family regulatory protein